MIRLTLDGEAHLAFAPDLHCIEMSLRSGDEPAWESKLSHFYLNKQGKRYKRALDPCRETHLHRTFVIGKSALYEAIWYPRGRIGAGHTAVMRFKMTEEKRGWKSFLMEIEDLNRQTTFHFKDLREAGGANVTVLKPGQKAAWRFGNLDRLRPTTRFDRLDTFEVG